MRSETSKKILSETSEETKQKVRKTANQIVTNKTKPIMRTIKELLEVMLENQQYFKNGLCTWVAILRFEELITTSESYQLHKYIDDNRSFILSSFDAFNERIKKSGYYWTRGNIKPRIKWIQKHIKLNS